MAAAFFNQIADPSKARAISAGTVPGSRVHADVIDAMRERALDLSTAVPTKLTPELARQAQVLITMGCGDACPFLPGARREDWTIDDPQGKPQTRVREIRDEIQRRVERLIDREGWRRSMP